MDSNSRTSLLCRLTGGSNGYLAVKYSNWAMDDNGIDAANSPEATEQLGGDYAMIRLAEIYLSAAGGYPQRAGLPTRRSHM